MFHVDFLAFVKQMEWVRTQWAAAEAEASRLQTELDEALKTLSKWEAKFAHVRKLLDSEKRERNIVMKKYKELVSLDKNIKGIYQINLKMNEMYRHSSFQFSNIYSYILTYYFICDTYRFLT